MKTESEVTAGTLSKPQTNLLPHFFIKLYGRRYKIFKRKPDRGAPYYVKVERRGVRYRRCLETNVQTDAERQAKNVIELIMNDQIDELQASKLRGAPKPEIPSVATLGDIIAAYRQRAAVFVRPRTIADNINALRLIVREGLGKPQLESEQVDRLKCDLLTGRLISRFEENRLRPAMGDEERRQSILVSINAYARAARSIFKDKLRKAYTRDLNLVLPDLADFLEEEFEQPARIVKEVAPAELIQKTFAESLKLRESDRPSYIAFLLSVCSLRRGEIQRAEWSWIDPVRSTIRVPRESKSKVVRFIPLPESVMKELNEFKAADMGDRPEWDQTFVLPCPAAGQGGLGAKARAQAIIKRVNKWMRDIGWDTRHTLHELRAFYLRELRKKYGLEVASEVAGHSDLRVTRTHYTGALDVSGITVPLPV